MILFDNVSFVDVHVAKAMMTVDSGLYGSVPLLTITCISEGGPATSIIWTRDSQEIFGQTVTIFNDTERAQYIHTLTQIGRLGGNYKCNISNNKPSSDSANLYVQGKTLFYVFAVYSLFTLFHHNSYPFLIQILLSCFLSE